jgi:hypothetical protein
MAVVYNFLMNLCCLLLILASGNTGEDYDSDTEKEHAHQAANDDLRRLHLL